MISLWEHHAPPSSNWASAGANAGVPVCDGWIPAGSPGSQTKPGELALASADLWKSAHAFRLNLFHCLSLCDFRQAFCCFWVQWRELNCISYNLISTPNFYCGKLLQGETAFVHMRLPCAGTEKASKALGLKEHVGVKFLGMLKLMKLPERWTQNRSMEILLHFSAVSGSKCLG